MRQDEINLYCYVVLKIANEKCGILPTDLFDRFIFAPKKEICVY